MAQEIPTIFQRFILTNEEELAGHSFSTTQRLVIQNIIAEAAEEKVRLTFDPLNPNAFMQREAELQGTIGTLTQLLAKYTDLLEAAVQSQLQSQLNQNQSNFSE